MMRKFYASLFPILLTGCTHVPTDGDFASVQRLVNERTPEKVYWYQGGDKDAQVREEQDALLTQPLTARSAVQISLLNNRTLQSEYENLGIAQADLVQAGLLNNPVLFASIRFPHGREGGNNTEFDLAQEFLDILLRPARQRLAEQEFNRVKVRVANTVLMHVQTVKAAFIRFQGAKKLHKIMKVATEAATASYELAQRFDEAGNLSELVLAQERSAAADMVAALMQARADLQSTRDDLNSLMGLAGQQRNWVSEEGLPGLPARDPDAGTLELLALENRLDLKELDVEIAQLEEALKLTRSYRFIGGASVGVSTEREPDGARVTGPNFSVEIPLFDQKRAEIARLESIIARSRAHYAAMSATIQNEVHAAANRVRAAREIVEYHRDELIPAQEQVVRFTQQEQNYMLVDVFELLYARRQATESYRGFIEGLTEYWVSRLELAWLAGSGLTVTQEATISGEEDEIQQGTGPDMNQEHHH